MRKDSWEHLVILVDVALPLHYEPLQVSLPVSPLYHLPVLLLFAPFLLKLALV
jgi:hypothetical protein